MITDDNFMKRCNWANSSEIERDYHDKIWGIPIHDDRLLFEMLILESAQSGLSWVTILKKREAYLKAFDNFNVTKISLYSQNTVEKLMKNPNIVRNKLKIQATIENSKRFLEIQKDYGSFDSYIWSFSGSKTIINSWEKQSDVPVHTLESTTMSKSLKNKGFKFIGPTVCYSFMQATGMVNDHLLDCFRHQQLTLRQKS